MLVEPLYSGNLGAVCRVCANFGVDELVLVRPQCEVNCSESRKAACGASRFVLEQAKVVKDLSEALAGTTRSLALSRRTGRSRQPFATLGDRSAPSLPAHAEDVAFVFGREDSGLSTAELEHCTEVWQLPTHGLMPSMNLSHAVSVCLYEWQRQQLVLEERCEQIPIGDERSLRDRRAESSQLEALRRRLGMTLEACHETLQVDDSRSPERFLRILWQSVQRARLSASEVQAWHGYFSFVGRAVSLSDRQG